MSQQELLTRVVGVLEAAGIDYMLTGSVVASLQGEPRASHDIDLVVALTADGAEALIRAFLPPKYYLDRFSVEAARRSNDQYRQFNLMELEDGDKVDFWLLSNEPFDQSRFARRYEDEFNGLRAMASRPEDTILMKLCWAKMSGGSDKQFGDCVAIYEVQFGHLEMAYIDRWAAQLEVESQWQEVKSRAKLR